MAVRRFTLTTYRSGARSPGSLSGPIRSPAWGVRLVRRAASCGFVGDGHCSAIRSRPSLRSLSAGRSNGQSRSTASRDTPPNFVQTGISRGFATFCLSPRTQVWPMPCPWRSNTTHGSSRNAATGIFSSPCSRLSPSTLTTHHCQLPIRPHWARSSKRSSANCCRQSSRSSVLTRHTLDPRIRAKRMIPLNRHLHHAVVVGASSGVGKLVADALTEHGTVVSTVGRTQPAPPYARHHQCSDLATLDWTNAYDEAQANAHVAIDAVVYVAGEPTFGRTSQIPPPRPRDLFDANFWAPASAALAAEQLWAAPPSGTFVSVPSISPDPPVPSQPHY